MPGRFEGKVAIVTGSSNGIGRATAQLFAEEGAKVTITGRSEKSLNDTKQLLLSSGAKEENIAEVLGDMRDENVQKKLIDLTLEKFGQIDILVNNAGGAGPDNNTQQGFDQGIELYEYIMDLNTKSVLTLTKLAMPHLIKTKGEVIMVSSIAGLPQANMAVPYYGMSKAALDQLTRALAATYIKQGVRVNSVNPGPVQTAIMTRNGMPDEMLQQMMAMLGDERLCPIGRVGQPREIAESIAFLADRKVSEFIVGHCLVIDGGCALLNSLMSQCANSMQKKE